MTIVAKPVIAKRYWILKQNDQKVGALEADNGEYVMRIDNQVRRFKTIPMVRRSVDIEFDTVEKTTPSKPQQVYGYDTKCRTFNAMWNLKYKLPLFTKEKKSKSWYAAGWYRVKQHRTWKIVQNPKLILLERYQYQGPFHTQEQAQEHESTHTPIC
jgi:hypothetical protein